jgi:hypothetical protein
MVAHRAVAAERNDGAAGVHLRIPAPAGEIRPFDAVAGEACPTCGAAVIVTYEAADAIEVALTCDCGQLAVLA